MRIDQIPKGYSEAMYNGKRYSLTRTDRIEGRSMSVYARELGGNDVISFNYYQTGINGQLKPCEMPMEKIQAFLAGAVAIR